MLMKASSNVIVMYNTVHNDNQDSKHKYIYIRVETN